MLRRVAALVAALLLIASPEALCAADAGLRGRTVAQALASLERPGVRFLFSSQLVTDALRVRVEPTATDPVDVARELLRPHGLGLEGVQPGLFAVVRTGAAEPEAPTAVAPIAPVDLSEVMVSASRYQVGDDASQATHVTPEALTQPPAIADDPVRRLGRLPGISRDGFSARPHVRGGEDTEVLTLFDGFPLRDAVHLPGYGSFFSVFDARLLRSATVFTGGFPALYGNRMSAVVDLHTIDALSEPRRSFGLDFFNASARAGGETASGAIDYLGLARAGTLRPLLEVVDPDVTRPSYGDVYLRVGSGSPDGFRLSANLLWSSDELGILDQERAEEAVVHGGRRYLWLHGEGRVDETLALQVWLGQSELNSRRVGTVAQVGVVTGEVFDDRRSTLYEARGLADWDVSAHDFLQAGFELTDEIAHYRYHAQARYSPAMTELFARAANLERDLELRPVRRRGALFASNRWLLSDAVTTEFGLRAQRLFTRGQDSDWISEPRASIRWQVARGTDLRASWGQFNQIDDVSELAVEDGVTRFPVPQRSEHFVVGAQRRWSEAWGLRLEVYHKRQTSPRARYENILNPKAILAEIAPDRIELDPDSAQTHGAELTADYAQAALDATLSLSWSHAHDRMHGASIARSWDQPWGVNGGLTWTAGPWLWSATADLHRGWPRTLLISGSDGVLRLGERNGDRLPLYRELDLKGQYTRRLAQGELAFSLELINAQIRPNTCCTEILVDQQTGRLRSGRAVWLPLIPSLGIRFSY